LYLLRPIEEGASKFDHIVHSIIISAIVGANPIIGFGHMINGLLFGEQAICDANIYW
jgi:hypothetical protein